MYGFSMSVSKSERHVTGFLLHIENIDLKHIFVSCLNLFFKFCAAL